MRKSVKFTVASLCIAGGIAGCSTAMASGHATPVAPKVTHSAPAAPATQAPASHKAAAPATHKAVAPPTHKAPQITVSEQQALDSAQSYLDMGGFSHDGLVSQLKFEKFSQADAEWAADHSGADWNAQAVDSAKSYMDMGGFSRGSLIDQLQFEKFTYAQASYAASKVGL
jgi:3-oxoacyl-ACP reductase-like protein